VACIMRLNYCQEKNEDSRTLIMTSVHSFLCVYFSWFKLFTL